MMDLDQQYELGMRSRGIKMAACSCGSVTFQRIAQTQNGMTGECVRCGKFGILITLPRLQHAVADQDNGGRHGLEKRGGQICHRGARACLTPSCK